MEHKAESARLAFYTVTEAADLLRIDAATIYRAIREGEFPAIRVRSRYVVPEVALLAMVELATESGGCVDVARFAAEHRLAREMARAASRMSEGGGRR